MKPSLGSLKKAFVSFESALAVAPSNDLERDGVLQRFEYTFELCWKMLKKYFEYKAISCEASPRELIREAAAQSLIPSAAEWFEYLKGRNLTSHTYNEDTAKDAFDVAVRFCAAARDLIRELETRLDRD